MSIAVENLTVDYGGNTVLNGLSLTIANGEFFTLLGPSGCGKTTLLRTIAGFLPAVNGQIRFGDRDVTHLPAHQRDIGMVFQDYALFPNRNVFENVAYGLRARKVNEPDIKKRVGEALERVGLSAFAARLPAALSGGQRQRVALARALVIKPQVLLMDEPLSNLDAKLRVQIRETIRALQQESGITTVFVTHDQEEALALSDQIGVMDRGRLRQVGTPQEIYHRPASGYVADFVGGANLLAVPDGVKTSPIIFPFGSLAVAPVSSFQGPAVIAIRPEDITIGSATAGPNVFNGKVVARSFLGDKTAYRVALAGNFNLLVHCHGDAHEWPIGTTCSVHIPAASARMIEP